MRLTARWRRALPPEHLLGVIYGDEGDESGARRVLEAALRGGFQVIVAPSRMVSDADLLDLQRQSERALFIERTFEPMNLPDLPTVLLAASGMAVPSEWLYPGASSRLVVFPESTPDPVSPHLRLRDTLTCIPFMEMVT